MYTIRNNGSFQYAIVAPNGVVVGTIITAEIQVVQHIEDSLLEYSYKEDISELENRIENLDRDNLSLEQINTAIQNDIDRLQKEVETLKANGTSREAMQH